MLKDRLREARIRAGFTLDEVAQRVGVSKQTIQRYESGVISNIPPDNIEKIASALDTTPAELMGWKTNKPAIEVPSTMTLKAGTPEYILMRVFLQHSAAVQEEMARQAEKIDSTFAKNVSRLLKESGDINGFMKQTGLGFDTVGKLMQGDAVLIDPDEAERVSAFFGADIVDMFFGEPSYSPSAAIAKKFFSPEAIEAAQIQLVNKLFGRSIKTIPESTVSYDFIKALEKYVKNEIKPSYEKAKIAIRHMKSHDFDEWLSNFLKSIRLEDPDRYIKNDALYFLAGELYKSPALFQIEFKRNAYAVHNYMVLKYHESAK